MTDERIAEQTSPTQGTRRNAAGETRRRPQVASTRFASAPPSLCRCRSHRRRRTQRRNRCQPNLRHLPHTLSHNAWAGTAGCASQVPNALGTTEPRTLDRKHRLRILRMHRSPLWAPPLLSRNDRSHDREPGRIATHTHTTAASYIAVTAPSTPEHRALQRCAFIDRGCGRLAERPLFGEHAHTHTHTHWPTRWPSARLAQ